MRATFQKQEGHAESTEKQIAGHAQEVWWQLESPNCVLSCDPMGCSPELFRSWETAQVSVILKLKGPEV